MWSEKRLLVLKPMQQQKTIEFSKCMPTMNHWIKEIIQAYVQCR